MLPVISFDQVKDLIVHFYRIFINVVNNRLIKLQLKHFFCLFLWKYLFLNFYFSPGAHLFLKYLVIANFIFLCKLYVINIEKMNESISSEIKQTSPSVQKITYHFSCQGHLKHFQKTIDFVENLEMTHTVGWG